MLVGMATGLFHGDTPERQRMTELVEEGILTVIWGEKRVLYYFERENGQDNIMYAPASRSFANRSVSSFYIHNYCCLIITLAKFSSCIPSQRCKH